jgi:hypothetical protein
VRNQAISVFDTGPDGHRGHGESTGAGNGSKAKR